MSCADVEECGVSAAETLEQDMDFSSEEAPEIFLAPAEKENKRRHALKKAVSEEEKQGLSTRLAEEQR